MTRTGRTGIGVAGLSRGFVLTAAALAHHPRARLVAAADPRPEARSRFESDFGGRAYETLDAMLADPAVDAVYVATPHGLHAEQVIAACAAGRHVLVEKPMAVTLAECTAMGEAAARAGVVLMVGPSHAYDGPYRHMRALIEAGTVGAPRMLWMANHTDFLNRPRTPAELDTARGGGVLYSQAAHQVDVARLLMAAPVTEVHCAAFRLDPSRPTEGAYTAQLRFAGGGAASLTYGGHGRFDSDLFLDWVGETGADRPPSARNARRVAADPETERMQKAARAYGSDPAGAPPNAPPAHHEHFGAVLLSCEMADLRPTADGVWIHDSSGARFEPTPLPILPRAAVLDDFAAAVVDGEAPRHDAAWGSETLRVCLDMFRDALDAVPAKP
jgi:phthalate 4,5-cis-dihydrodiol dehydrogenase